MVSLTYLSDQLTVYIGLILLFFGLIGNGINIWIFSTVRNYRQTPCSFYFLIGSIFNFLYVLLNLPLRIISSINKIDLSVNSLIWCKIQGYFICLFGVISFSCSCLAIIDQYLITSKNISFRQLSNMKKYLSNININLNSLVISWYTNIYIL